MVFIGGLGSETRKKPFAEKKYKRSGGRLLEKESGDKVGGRKIDSSVKGKGRR